MIDRRRFLATAGAAALAPLVRRARAAEPDVVIVGAGAAGLSAAHALAQLGRSVELIEASTRIGGRAHTDTSIFGVPYDMGAHWLHNAGDNPFVPYAERAGLHVYEAPSEIELYAGGRVASEREENSYYAAYEAAVEAISRAGSEGRDIAPADVVPDGLEWSGLVHFSIGPYDMAKDFDHFSCADWWSANAGTDYFCREGFGALLAHWAEGIPATLSTPARRIDWGGDGVAVETARGTVRARACIVTVSMGVLAAGDIAFSPALPPEVQEAIGGLTMGTYNRVALQFSHNVFGTAEDQTVLYRMETHRGLPPRGVGFLTNVGGTGLVFADMGGGFAAEVEAGGQAAAIDFARGEVRKLLGSDADRAFVKGHATAWGRNRLTRGSYASAEPGAAGARAHLRRSFAERLWFAGEACSEHEWATVAGAWKYGFDVAQAVHATL